MELQLNNSQISTPSINRVSCLCCHIKYDQTGFEDVALKIAIMIIDAPRTDQLSHCLLISLVTTRLRSSAGGSSAASSAYVKKIHSLEGS